MLRFALAVGVGVSAGVAFGCSPKGGGDTPGCRTDVDCPAGTGCVITPGESTGTCMPGVTGTGTDGDGTDTGAEDGDTGSPGAPDAIDILLVVDNSGSMGEEQGALARAIGPLISEIEQADIDWRIGFTTSDNSNPWCGATTTPEAGALVASSCVNRQGQFTNQQGWLDVYDLACASNCVLDDAAIGLTAPWMERLDGAYNFQGDAGAVAACLAPMGIDGCGFESQLQSMSRALTRFDTEGEPSFGFMRDDASLAVILVTDEADCSSRVDAIFEQDGNKIFWDDLDDVFPTSAVCWNAGTACTPVGEGYDCVPADYDVSGGGLPSGDPASVLYPAADYIAQLDAIRTQKQAVNPAVEVFVAAIAGYAPTGETVYADIADPTFMKDFGIGPGCSEQVDSIACGFDDCTSVEGTCQGGVCRATQLAVPPVRIQAVQAAFAPEVGASVCSADYVDHLLEWASLFVNNG